jgi:hypothetical protein
MRSLATISSFALVRTASSLGRTTGLVRLAAVAMAIVACLLSATPLQSATTRPQAFTGKWVPTLSTIDPVTHQARILYVRIGKPLRYRDGIRFFVAIVVPCAASRSGCYATGRDSRHPFVLTTPLKWVKGKPVIIIDKDLEIYCGGGPSDRTVRDRKATAALMVSGEGPHELLAVGIDGCATGAWDDFGFAVLKKVR